MKASPVRPGDYIVRRHDIAAIWVAFFSRRQRRCRQEFFAEINLLGALSACPDGDCGSSGVPCGANEAPVHPLLVEVFAPAEGALEGWESPGVAPYQGNHGLPTG